MMCPDGPVCQIVYSMSDQTSTLIPIDRKLEAYHDILSAQSKFDSKFEF